MRAEMLERIHAAGFADITHAQISVFRFEGPEGRRPTEIATSAQLSKQTVNDVLGRLEQAGYLRRRPDPGDGRARVVRLTARGRRLDAAVWQAGREVEDAWRTRVGEPTWGVFREVLDRIARADPGGPASRAAEV
jgi:DNA-binding MarR family transcriptional regulator